MKTAFDNGRTNPKVATFAYRFTDLAGNCLQPGRTSRRPVAARQGLEGSRTG